LSQNAKPVQVTVTGAAGQIGYSLLFRIAHGDLLGPDQPLVLRLLEIEPALKALEGVAMELDDCAFPLLRETVLTSNTEEAFEGANWALLVGSVPRKQGMERGDLLSVNGGIFGPQGRAIAARAASDVRILVVGNPCNTNCLIARGNAPDIPAERWFAMTRLDENRGKSLLASRARVDVSEISNLGIWGNHSATQFPDARNARIGGRPVPEAIDDEEWLLGEFVTTVQQRGAAVIKARGASSAASAAARSRIRRPGRAVAFWCARASPSRRHGPPAIPSRRRRGARRPALTMAGRCRRTRQWRNGDKAGGPR